MAVRNINAGDVVFTGNGRPGVVQGQEERSGDLRIDRKNKSVASNIRHGYVNGMPPEVRAEFNNILDEVKELKDPMARVNLLTEKLAILEQDPRNQGLTRYLRAELVHIMNSYNLKAKEYSVPADQIRR